MPSVQPSASVAATGLGIRYIGKDYCYAFSGAFAASNTDQTLLDFTTGNSGYIVATLTLTPPIRMLAAGISGGYPRGWQLNFNSQTIGLYKADSAQQDMPTVVEVQILIPPLTNVVLTSVDSGSDANYSGTAHLTGRVYGAV